MLEVSNIQQYFKSGKGKIFQFYVTDEELMHILEAALTEDLIHYSLISYKYDGDRTYFFTEMPVEEFSNLRKNDYNRFYLRSHNITPHLDIPDVPVIGSNKRTDYEKYYLYRGLIDIQHGFKLEHKYFWESSIGLIDKYYDKNSPEVIYENKGYADIFNLLKKNINSFLIYKSKETWLDGRINISAKNNVSKGFFEAVKENKIITKIEFV